MARWTSIPCLGQELLIRTIGHTGGYVLVIQVFLLALILTLPFQKVVNLILVAIHAMMSTFTGAAIIPAFQNIAADLGVSLSKTAYLTSLTIAILAVAPMIWRPLCDKYGRRPIFLLSLICSLVGNIGCAKSPTYATMALCRAIVMFFLCPPAAVGSAVVTETFFKKDRARYIGIWTLMVTLGVPISPFIMGFVANNIGYRWIYWIIAIVSFKGYPCPQTDLNFLQINGVEFIAYFFLGPETRYIRTGVDHKGSEFKQEYFNFTTIDPRPLTIHDFIHPLGLGRKLCVVIPGVASAMVFVFASVLVAVELPQLFGEKFHFNPQQLGYQFTSLIIGSVIGEQFGGSISDYWMNRRAKKTGVRPEPEYRLWLSYFGFILTIIGVTVLLVRTQEAQPLHWNITPVIGIAIGGVGNQLVITVLITYAVDCYQEESASIGVFITFIRQMWGFLGPFWYVFGFLLSYLLFVIDFD